MRYTYAYLRDYFSERGLILEKVARGYQITNGRRIERYDTLEEVRERAATGSVIRSKYEREQESGQ